MVRAATRPSSVWVGGMRMSTIATSGLCIATCRSRSSGLSDCASTSKPDSSSSRTTPSRRRIESSAMTTRIALPSIAIVLRSGGKSRGSPSASTWKMWSGSGSPARRWMPRSRIVAPGTEPCVAAEASICPPWPAEPIRAARCTSMPVYPSSVTIASPVWRPMRTRTGLTPAHSCSISARCADTEAATASPASTNAAKSSSPCASMTVPLCAATVSRRIRRSSARIAA